MKLLCKTLDCLFKFKFLFSFTEKHAQVIFKYLFAVNKSAPRKQTRYDILILIIFVFKNAYVRIKLPGKSEAAVAGPASTFFRVVVFHSDKEFY